MNAKEFMNNYDKNGYCAGSTFGDFYYEDDEIELMMETYANYKTKELEAKILTYRQRLKKLKDGEEIEKMFVAPGEFIISEILDDFDEHFNITTK